MVFLLFFLGKMGLFWGSFTAFLRGHKGAFLGVFGSVKRGFLCVLWVYICVLL